MTTKRSLEQDPEYEAISSEIQEKRIKLLEDNVRNQTKKKIETIIKSNFEEAIRKNHEEIETIDDLLHEGRCMLDRLRACIITKYYGNLDQKVSESSVPPIHPCVKKYVGKRPRHLCGSLSTIDNKLSFSSKPNAEEPSTSSNSSNQISEKVWEVKPSSSSPADEISTRAPRFKQKCKIVVGNVSKFIPVWERSSSDYSTHQWMVYVRGDKHNPKIESFVKKVRFLLHPSYRPSDIVDISSPPFHLIKRGWGEFPVRVQLHFHDPRNKPVDIIHNLKLDKTFTGLQTLGSETVKEVLLFKPEVAASSTKPPSLSRHVPKASCSNNVAVPSSESISPDSRSLAENNDSKTHAVIKKDPNSLVINIKLLKNSGEDLSSTSVNTHSNSNPSSGSPVSEKKPVPKLIISNNKIVNKPPGANGIKASLVTCKDKEGHIVSARQSALTLKAPVNFTKLKNNNVLLNSVAAKGTKSVPCFILKCVPDKNTGQNRTYLIPLTDKNSGTRPISQANAEAEPAANTTDEESVIEKEPIFEETVVTTPNYELDVENIRMEYCKTFEELLKRVSKIFPLVKRGVDRSVFTFCANSLDEYHSWNIGKQRASEWKRAGMVRRSILDLLSKRKSLYLCPESVWSQGAIMIWLKKKGFVPMTTEKVTLLPEPKWSGVELCSLTDADSFVSSLTELKPNLVSSSEEEDINVVNTFEEKPVSARPICKASKDDCILPHFSEEALFVKETASQIGINIKPVEVESGLYAPVIEEMILSACQNFVTDLLGSSLNEGFSRLGGKICPEEVTVSDVYSVIKKSPEFDFLSNSSLGVLKEYKETT